MILGVIPARGGSKGVPRKNVRMLAGQPLIAWTIQAAKASRRLDRFVVSTEDAEIARVAREYGAEVLERPKELAADETPTLPVLQHALSVIPADTIVVLQATSPVREPGLIDRCIERFEQAGADSLATGFICKFTEYGSNTAQLRRQEIPGFFHNDGNLYVIRAAMLKDGDRYGKKLEKMGVSREENTEIDDEFDFWLAEKVLERQLARSRA